MVILSLTYFAILKGMAALFDMKTTMLIFAGDNNCDLYHDGHGINAVVKLGSFCPIIQKPFPFKDMTQDFARSHITRYIWQVSIRLLVVHHLKMASLLTNPKPHILRAFNMVLVCLSVPICSAKHNPRHNIMDSYLCFWCFFPHWVFLGFCLSWHVINFMFIMWGRRLKRFTSKNLWPSQGRCKNLWHLQGKEHHQCFRVSKGDIFGISKEENAFGFTTSFADVNSEQLNMQVHSNTDSVFFVWDNSTTGHICNDIQKLVQGTIWQTNKSLTTANGTGSCLQEGTVKIRLINDTGTQHIFILDNCLYHPDSPVNLLSMRWLAEKFLDANGNPDEETCIESRYSTHVLTWSFGQFKKRFPTPVSGLPEFLFDKGFCAYKSFCMQAQTLNVT